MKSAAIGFAALALALSTSTYAVQDVLPASLPSSRYDKLIEASPFALATKTEAPVEKGPGPFVHLFVATIAQFKDADGKTRDMVTFKSRADQSTFTLEGNEPNKEGYQIAGIEWSDRVGETKVTLKKGTEFGTVEFDKANVTGPAQPANPQARPGAAPARPGVPGVVTPNTNPAQRNNLRVPVPQVPRPTAVPAPNAIPKPAQPAATAVPVPGGVNPNSDRPRRVRIINTK
jgi:hypothetical protein